jgi:uncharacterized membrane protein
MNRPLLFALGGVTLLAAVLVFATSSLLPDPVATHFARGGRANGWMTHGGYLAFALGFNVLVPWLVFLVAGVVAPRYRSMPGVPRAVRDAADPEAAIAAMRTFAALLALLVAILATAMHVVLIEANAKVPASLDERLFFGVLAVFVAGLLAIVIGYARRFPRRR